MSSFSSQTARSDLADAVTAIRPFRVDVPEAKLVDLRRRIAATQWPDKETVPDSSQGVALATMQKLALHWATDYDWRKVEARLNALPQFMTEGRPTAIATALDRTGSIADELTRDDILDDITLYWVTNSGISAARLYWEYRGGFFDAKGVAIPVAVSAFPDELYQAPESWAQRAYPRLIHYNRLPEGGHFAAWEQPRLLTEELRAGFRLLR